MTERTRRMAALAMLGACGFALSGCMSSPTYGTDKTANEQLLGDISGILSIAPKNREPIEYKPRPELVRPAKGEAGSLPPPQESVAVASNPAWPESPEQKRARLRAEASENRDKPGWTPQIENDISLASAQPSGPVIPDRAADTGVAPINSIAANRKKQREQFKASLAETKQGSDTRRKYLSEPPLTYRQPSDTAPVGDVGEDELKKERKRRAAARKAGGGSSWADLWPF